MRLVVATAQASLALELPRLSTPGLLRGAPLLHQEWVLLVGCKLVLRTHVVALMVHVMRISLSKILPQVLGALPSVGCAELICLNYFWWEPVEGAELVVRGDEDLLEILLQ